MTRPKDTPRRHDRLDPAAVLGSPRTAQWLLGALTWLALTALLPLVFRGPGAGEAARRFTLTSMPLHALYLLLAASLVLGMARRVKTVRRRVSADPKPRVRPDADSSLAAVPFDAARGERSLRRAGYGHVASGDGWVWGVKSRWSPVGTLVLHGAVLLGLIGASVAALPGTERTMHADAVVDAPLRAPFGPRELTLTSLEARTAPDGSVERLTAVVTLPNGRTLHVRPDVPALVDPVTGIHIEGFDRAATFSLTPSSSVQPVVSRTAALRLAGRGASDTTVVRAGSLGTYRITVRPGDGPDTGVVATVERLQKGGTWRLLRSGLPLRPGQAVRLGPARLRFDGLRPYAMLRLHRSPAALVIAVALMLGLVGASLRLMLPRTEATIARTDGGTTVTVHADVYRASKAASAALASSLEDPR